MGIKRGHDLEPQSELERDLVALLQRHGFGITSFKVEESNMDTDAPTVRLGRIHVTMEREATHEEAGQASALRSIAGQSSSRSTKAHRNPGPPWMTRDELLSCPPGSNALVDDGDFVSHCWVIQDEDGEIRLVVSDRFEKGDRHG